jgi:hypothetical protein
MHHSYTLHMKNVITSLNNDRRPSHRIHPHRRKVISKQRIPQTKKALFAPFLCILNNSYAVAAAWASSASRVSRLYRTLNRTTEKNHASVNPNTTTNNTGAISIAVALVPAVE